MNVLAVTAACDAPEEELRTRALPPVHPRPADVLDGVFGASVRVARDVEGTDARRAVLRGTGGHEAPPSCPRM